MTPQPAGQVIPPNPGLPPVGAVPTFTETTNTGPSTTWSRSTKDPTARRIEAAKAFDAATAQSAEVLERQRQAAAEIERLEAEAAAEKVRLQAEAAARAAAEQQARAQQHQALLAQEAKVREDLAAAAKDNDRGYWDDRSTGAKILSAILVGLGEGAHDGPGPSPARQIIDAKIAEDRARKEARLGYAHGNVEAAEKFTARGMAEADAARQRIANEQIVSLQKLADQLEAAKKRIPSKSLEIEKARADVIAAAEEKKVQQEADLAATVNRGGDSGRVSTRSVEGEKVGTGGGDSLAAKQAAFAAEEAARNFAKGEALLSQDPDVQRRVNEALKAEGLAAEESKVASVFRRGLQGLGVLPRGVAERLKGDENALELLRLLAPANTQQARQTDPQGALNEYSMKKGEEGVGTAGRTPEQQIKIFREFREAKEREAAALAPKKSVVAASASGISKAELAEMLSWAKSHKNSKNAQDRAAAAEILKRLSTVGGK